MRRASTVSRPTSASRNHTEAQRRLGMLGPQLFLVHREGALIVGPRRRHLPLRLQQNPQVVETPCRLRMLGPQHCLVYREGALVDPDLRQPRWRDWGPAAASPGNGGGGLAAPLPGSSRRQSRRQNALPRNASGAVHRSMPRQAKRACGRWPRGGRHPGMAWSGRPWSAP